MSFSAEVKEELSNISNYNKKDLLEAEFIGYLSSQNCIIENGYTNIFTENEFNIERIYKILFNLKIDYEPEIDGKKYIAKIYNFKVNNLEDLHSEDEKKAFIRGVFLGSGSVNDPNKKYHLEILIKEKDVSIYIQNILKSVEIKVKILNTNNTIYIKEGEEISKFLAYIGAQKSVLKFEEIRVIKDLRNTVNRQVNCETANLTKTVNAAVVQIDAINFLKKMKKFDDLPKNLIEIAELRVKYPEMSLKLLGENLEKPIGKSGVNHRLNKIIEISEEIKKGV